MLLLTTFVTYNNYIPLVSSTFFIEKEQERAMDLDVDVVKANAKKDFEICSYSNDIWNQQVAAMRRERLAKERTARISEISTKLDVKTRRDSRHQRKVDSEIRKAKEEAPTFITAENIDVAIEYALENIVNRNSAIDIKGNLYKDEAKTVESSTTS